MASKELIKRTAKDVKAYRESNGKWFMSVVYTVEDEHSIREVWYPKIELPVDNALITTAWAWGSQSDCIMELPSRALVVLAGSTVVDGQEEICLCRETLIKHKPEKLTMEEIEKRLGYKVEIVSK